MSMITAEFEQWARAVLKTSSLDKLDPATQLKVIHGLAIELRAFVTLVKEEAKLYPDDDHGYKVSSASIGYALEEVCRRFGLEVKS